jgi:predicted CXXCH cytochrome family protein
VKRFWAILAAVLVLAACVRIQAQFTTVKKSDILNSKHDFRVTSTATIKSVSEEDPCVFCHTPHNATPGPELWNHTMGTTNFPSYTSTTMVSTVGQISESDSSKLCLSCHDGTIALASTVNNGDIDFVQGPDYKLPQDSPSNIAKDATIGFQDDHPFAFTPSTSNGEIKLPPPGDAVRLENGKVQCVSCHDPHSEKIDVTEGKFLVKPNQASALCLTCHNTTGWTGSAHQAPPATSPDDKYTSAQGAHTGYIGVANNGCESCHRPHTAGTGPRLLKFVEENTCYKCHDGSVAPLNVQSDLTTKTYRHPVDITPSVHDASEGSPGSSIPLPETSASTPRHSECADCHNSHQARPSPPGVPTTAPGVTPPLAGASGIDVAKAYQKQAANEYQICFKCHADSVNRPQLTDTTQRFGRYPRRQFDVGNPDAFNTRIEFTQGISFHPVTRINPSASATSLRPSFMVQLDNVTPIQTRPLSPTSMIYCSDCHASDTNRTLSATATGATGPHGSNVEHILERAYPMETPPPTDATHPVGSTGNPFGYTPGMYALCDKCHQVDAIIYADKDSFPKHKIHINETSCSTCHDPHASQSNRLINFDLSIVGPSSMGPVQFTNDGAGHGTCNLQCHGHDHKNTNY